MSYPKELDEYEDGDLKKELERRKECRLQGLCHYCNQSLVTHTCKFALWQAGPPSFSTHTDKNGKKTYFFEKNACYLLEFETGDRFVVARHVLDEDLGPKLMDLDNGGYVSDPVKRHFKVPDPGGYNNDVG